LFLADFFKWRLALLLIQKGKHLEFSFRLTILISLVPGAGFEPPSWKPTGDLKSNEDIFSNYGGKHPKLPKVFFVPPHRRFVRSH